MIKIEATERLLAAVPNPAMHKLCEDLNDAEGDEVADINKDGSLLDVNLPMDAVEVLVKKVGFKKTGPGFYFNGKLEIVIKKPTDGSAGHRTIVKRISG